MVLVSLFVKFYGERCEAERSICVITKKNDYSLGSLCQMPKKL